MAINTRDTHTRWWHYRGHTDGSGVAQCPRTCWSNKRSDDVCCTTDGVTVILARSCNHMRMYMSRVQRSKCILSQFAVHQLHLDGLECSVSRFTYFPKCVIYAYTSTELYVFLAGMVGHRNVCGGPLSGPPPSNHTTDKKSVHNISHV